MWNMCTKKWKSTEFCHNFILFIIQVPSCRFYPSWTFKYFSSILIFHSISYKMISLFHQDKHLFRKLLKYTINFSWKIFLTCFVIIIISLQYFFLLMKLIAWKSSILQYDICRWFSPLNFRQSSTSVSFPFLLVIGFRHFMSLVMDPYFIYWDRLQCLVRLLFVRLLKSIQMFECSE